MEFKTYLARGVGPSRPFFVGGNWKCNCTKAQVKAIVDLMNGAGTLPLSTEVVIAVPSLHLQLVQSIIRENIAVSAQDVCYKENYGAFTGELCAPMLVDSGIKWTLTGHSERRVGFGGVGESSEIVAVKTKNGIKAGMSVIFCCGEMLQDRENGTTMNVVVDQLKPLVAALAIKDWSKLVIAYEPVWAIGTGKVATPEQAEETHLNIRNWISQNVSADVASNVRIIYGGSVKSSNAKQLMACPNIDGFLVGGASLLPEFVDIIKA